MHVFLGLAGFLGVLASLIIIIVRAKKGQSKKESLIALSVCLVLLVIALIIKPSPRAAAQDAAVPEMAAPAETSAPVSEPAPAAFDTVLPSEAPSEVPVAIPEPDQTPTPVPTEIPTSVPSPTVPPVTDEQLDEGYLDAWFDDSVMVGDSIAGGLGMYVTNERGNNRPCLGSMRIIGTSGMTLKNALAAEKKEKQGQVLFRSRFMTISEVVEITQAKRLFLMIGVRDLEWYSAEKLIEVYGEIISIIKTDHPDLDVYVHSLMPTVKEWAVSVHLNYETHKAANEKLRAFCEENGYTYLELADLVRDEDGFLNYEYSGPDYSWHLNDPGKAIWVKLLRSCARDEYYAGIWKPEDNTND